MESTVPGSLAVLGKRQDRAQGAAAILTQSLPKVLGVVSAPSLGNDASNQVRVTPGVIDAYGRTKEVRM